jgi:peptidoglycan-associated lipoprotein
MKKITSFLCFLLPALCLAQKRDFKLTDTIKKLDPGISREHVLHGVVFDFDKATIRPESFAVLDSAVVFIKANPQLTIKVENHTDSRSYRDSYHPKLTQKRANVIVDYFVSKGIPQNRMIAQGYGKIKPLVTDAEIRLYKTKEQQELAHQKNRRTVLKIINMTE